MKRFGCMTWFVGAILLLVAWFKIYTWPSVIRYKVMVEVETPQGLRSGSAVREGTYRKEPAWTPEMHGASFMLRGEAVVVDLPDGQNLFALLRGHINIDNDNDEDIVFRLIGIPQAWSLARKTKRLIVVPQNLQPLLVTFRDIADPKSVERVDPNNLAASFGKGVQLKRITVAVTDEPVTVGIEKRLSLLGIHEGHGLDRTGGVSANPSLAQQLGYTDFLRR